MQSSVGKLAFACVALLAVAGCDVGGIVKGSGKGSAEGVKAAGKNDYFNKAFGLTVTAPEGWFVADNDQTKKLMDSGVDLAAVGNDKLKAIAQASQGNALNIFAFFAHPPGAPVPTNPSVLGVAEDVSAAPGVTNGKDYFFHVRAMMAQSTMAPTFEDGYKTRTIGGQAFDEMDGHMDLNGISVKQSYFAAKHGNNVVSIVQSWVSDDEHKATNTVIDSIKLDWK
jgi:hypothetical protein